METMNAAVVTSFDEPPHYQKVLAPNPTGDDEFLVDVLAVGLHPRVRSGAAGTHYTSTGTLPMTPGIDGVGERSDGTLVYFVADDDVRGTMADQAVVDVRRSIELPDRVDIAKIAAAMNPAMSSWVALRRRVALKPGQSVLVLGATGNAGSMAVQIAKRLGAGYVIGAGRDLTRLHALTTVGADDVVQLTDDADATAASLGAAAPEVDIVLDYVWGSPARQAMMALLSNRLDRSRELNWIQIGATAGASLELPSVVLRSANFRLQGSGQGAVAPTTYLTELPSLIEEINSGTITVTTNCKALRDVESVWRRPDLPGERIVLFPGGTELERQNHVETSKFLGDNNGNPPYRDVQSIQDLS